MPSNVFNPVINENDISDINFRSSLTLVSLSLDDRGSYTCNATNVAGSDNKTVEVNVLGERFHIAQNTGYTTLPMSRA